MDGDSLQDLFKPAHSPQDGSLHFEGDVDWESLLNGCGNGFGVGDSINGLGDGRSSRRTPSPDNDSNSDSGVSGVSMKHELGSGSIYSSEPSPLSEAPCDMLYSLSNASSPLDPTSYIPTCGTFHNFDILTSMTSDPILLPSDHVNLCSPLLNDPMNAGVVAATSDNNMDIVAMAAGINNMDAISLATAAGDMDAVGMTMVGGDECDLSSNLEGLLDMPGAEALLSPPTSSAVGSAGLDMVTVTGDLGGLADNLNIDSGFPDLLAFSDGTVLSDSNSTATLLSESVRPTTSNVNTHGNLLIPKEEAIRSKTPSSRFSAVANGCLSGGSENTWAGDLGLVGESTRVSDSPLLLRRLPACSVSTAGAGAGSVTVVRRDSKTGSVTAAESAASIAHQQGVEKVLLTNKRIRPKPATSIGYHTELQPDAKRERRTQPLLASQPQQVVLTAADIVKLTQTGQFTITTTTTSSLHATSRVIKAEPVVVSSCMSTSSSASPTTTPHSSNPTVTPYSSNPATPVGCSSSGVPSPRNPATPIGAQDFMSGGSVVHLQQQQPQPPVFQTEEELRNWKKQQRLIKNREAACLSRKRKRDQMDSLQERLECVNEENGRLKEENERLRREHEERVRTGSGLRQENVELKRKIAALENECVKLRKPSGMGGGVGRMPYGRVIATLMVGGILLLNLSFLSLRWSSDPGGELEPLGGPVTIHGRSLLAASPQYETSYDQEDQKSSARHRRSASPKQSIRRAANRQSEDGVELTRSAHDGVGYGKNTTEGRDIPVQKGAGAVMRNGSSDMGALLQDISNILQCPTVYNKTETQRLMNELASWALRSQMVKSSLPSRRIRKPKKTLRKPKYRGGDTYPMQLFGRQEGPTRGFYEAINRRNDTFYVVSFRRDHWLLPASAHNKTNRPRMSLVVPAFMLNDSMKGSNQRRDRGPVTMLQIDCEVMDTRFVSLARDVVPSWYEPEQTIIGSSNQAPVPGA